MDEPKYEVSISFKNEDSCTATLCKSGVTALFEAILCGRPFHVFRCTEGDKTLFRLSEVVYVISKKEGR